MRWPSRLCRAWFAIALTALIWGNAVPAADALTTRVSTRSVDLDRSLSRAVHPRCVLLPLHPREAERSAAQRHAGIYIWDPTGGPNELVQVRTAPTAGTLSFAGSLWAATDRNSSVIAWVGRTADTGPYDRVHYRAFGTPTSKSPLAIAHRCLFVLNYESSSLRRHDKRNRRPSFQSAPICPLRPIQKGTDP